MKQKQNLIGMKFGKLIVVDEAPYHINDPSPYWKCKCECGNETNVRTYTLTSGITKTCGGIHHRTASEHYKWNGYGEISGRYICDIKKHAKQRCVPFTITKKEMWEQFLKQNKSCALTGWPISFCSGKDKYDTTASLDRIDSTKGYIKENIQWVHKDINWFKRDYPQDEFLKLCAAITNHTSKNKL